MKLHIKITSLILALLFILSLALTACTPDNGNDDTTSSSDDTSSEETTAVTEIDRTSFELVSGGQSHFKIVRPQNLPTSDPEVVAAMDIRKTINNSTGVSPAIGDDWIANGASYDSESIEILVGFTAHPEVAEVAADLGYGDYTVEVCGNKIVVLGFTDEAMTRAARELCDLINDSVTTTDDGTKSLILDTVRINSSRTIDKYLSSVPRFEKGELILACESGHEVREFVVGSLTQNDYEEYLTVLEADGYTTHSTHSIAENDFAILYNNEYTLNVGYYDYSDEVRVIIEDYADKTLPPLKSENNLPTVTTSQVTMLGCEAIYSGEYQTNGQSMLYRLSDGRFVIFDGGHGGNSAIFASELIKELREQSKDYAKTDKDITIAAWIITHPHTDHMGMFVQRASDFKVFNVECVMGNFITESCFDSANAANSSFASGKYVNYAKVPEITEKTLGTEYVIPHVGQAYYIGDTVFEILYTIESFYPDVPNAFNTTSLVVRSTTTDASGKTSSVMVTGDATGAALGICYKMYGKNLKCDVVQVAHHGGSPYGSVDLLGQAYMAMAPTTLLWCIGTHKFTSVWNNSHNGPLYNTAQNPNYTESYVAGWHGTTVILPLPYTVGGAIVKEAKEP